LTVLKGSNQNDCDILFSGFAISGDVSERKPGRSRMMSASQAVTGRMP